MRTSLLLCCAVMLALVSGCGFKPMYGKKAGGYNSDDTSKIYAGVTVDSMPRREGQILHMELEDALNPNGKIPAHPEYRLAASISINEVAIGVARDATVSRFNIYFDSHYTLYRNSDGKAVTTGSIRHVGSYNNQANAYYSTYISRDDGIKRGLVEVAELYRMRLASYLSEGAPEQKNPPKMQPLPSYPNPSWNDGAASTLGAPPIPGAVAIPR
jgi:LPS-assembly lipoprotein